MTRRDLFEHLAHAAAALALGALASGCDDGAPAGDPTPEGVHTGTLGVVVEWSTDGPALGENTLDLTVTDAAGAPLDGADVTVTTYMPAHGHGSPRDPVVTSLGGGRYRATSVVLHMPGSWRLTVRAEQAGAWGQRVLNFSLEG